MLQAVVIVLMLNGVQVDLPAPAYLVGSYAYVPARAVLERLRPVADVSSRTWGFFEARVAERMQLIRLDMARGAADDALRLAGEFDRAVLIDLVFLRESLEIRLRAATQLGRRAVQAELRARLAQLDRGRRGAGGRT